MKNAMSNIIIGFTISKNEIDHATIDVFKSNLSVKKISHNNLLIYLWGIGDIDKCKIESKYSLSFPLNDSLLDRNILISLKNENVVIENDWLGSIPVFYNPNELIVSTLTLKTLKDKTIHPEGLNNYFEFGYSVFEHTPFKDVKFMRYFSKIVISSNCLSVVYKDDPILENGLFEKTNDEEVVLDKIKTYISKIENGTTGDIIIPTSGGYDSRLLNICVRNKHRIRSYTYGISRDQSESYEVVNAKMISKILGTRWKQIEIGHFHQYIYEWHNIYGFSTHLHGMYHIEFYKRILNNNLFSENSTFLSGIIGDAWAGSVNIPKINSLDDINKLSYSHGMNLKREYFNSNSDIELKNDFFVKNKDVLKNEKIRIIFSMRIKLMLLSYLINIPEYFGFPVWTPFLNFDIATSMMNIRDDRRKHRIWQRKIFIENEIDLESMKLKTNNSNTLDYDAFNNFNFEPIDIKLMKAYVKKEYLFNINKKLAKKGGLISNLIYKLINIRYIGRLIWIISIKNYALDKLYSYYIIKPIEMDLKGEK